MIRKALTLFMVVFAAVFARPAFANSKILEWIKPAGGTENRLTLLFYRAPKPIVWETPGAMVRAAIWNTLSGDASALSHIDVAVNCAGDAPVMMGMGRTKSASLVFSVLMGRQSLEMLTDSYPGHFITENDILDQLPGSLRDNRVRALNFKISSAACKRAQTYLRDYKARGYQDIYAGFTANPFRGEGAGCAAFGISVVKVAGLLDYELKAAWTRQLEIPRRLMNSPTQRAEKGFWSFMLGANEKWGSPGEATQSVTIYDPELMYNWVGKMAPGALVFELDRTGARVPNDDYWQYPWPP